MVEFITGFFISIPLIALNDTLLEWGSKEPTKSIGIVSIMFGVNCAVILLSLIHI